MDGPIPSEPPQPRRRRQPSGMPRSWDPSIAHIRSSFGGQVRSTKPSQPQFSFGSDDRDALDMFKVRAPSTCRLPATPPFACPRPAKPSMCSTSTLSATTKQPAFMCGCPADRVRPQEHRAFGNWPRLPWTLHSTPMVLCGRAAAVSQEVPSQLGLWHEAHWQGPWRLLSCLLRCLCNGPSEVALGMVIRTWLVGCMHAHRGELSGLRYISLVSMPRFTPLVCSLHAPLCVACGLLLHLLSLLVALVFTSWKQFLTFEIVPCRTPRPICRGPVHTTSSAHGCVTRLHQAACVWVPVNGVCAVNRPSWLRCSSAEYARRCRGVGDCWA